VIPSTLLGLVVLAASIGPGYVWVLVAETRVPRSRRTQLLEVAELIVIGGSASTLAFIVTLSFASWVSLIDTDALATDGTDYVLRHPARGLGVVLVGLALAYAAAYVAARIVYRKRPSIIGHGHSAWHSLLTAAKNRAAWATVDLRNGTTISGWAYLWTVDEVPPAERDLVLISAFGKRLKIRPPNSDTVFDSPDSAVALNGADVLSISASYRSLAQKQREQRLLQAAREYPTGPVPPVQS
jgi:Family of unknown function (DUF6338)